MFYRCYNRYLVNFKSSFLLIIEKIKTKKSEQAKFWCTPARLFRVGHPEDRDPGSRRVKGQEGQASVDRICGLEPGPPSLRRRRPTVRRISPLTTIESSKWGSEPTFRFVITFTVERENSWTFRNLQPCAWKRGLAFFSSLEKEDNEWIVLNTT